VCITCPLNDTKSGIYNLLSKAAADEVMIMIGAIKSLDLKTAHDTNLGVCTACGCPMRGKVWAPMENLMANMPPDVWPKLSRQPKCWMLTEGGRE
jgi:hypothetical protein